MRKIKLLIILLVPLLFITGCSENNLVKASKNTSITDKGLNSYRCKAEVVNGEDRINYIVLNKENKEYEISVFSDNGSYNYSIRDESKVVNHTPSNNENIEGININYNYSNTDKYLEELKNVTGIKESEITISKVKYKKYDFKISKKSLNKLLKDFYIKVKKDGNGYVYVDKDNHVYIINYTSGDTLISVSYTRYEK